jgi:hypothetical protein
VIPPAPAKPAFAAFAKTDSDLIAAAMAPDRLPERRQSDINVAEMSPERRLSGIDVAAMPLAAWRRGADVVGSGGRLRGYGLF